MTEHAQAHAHASRLDPALETAAALRGIRKEHKQQQAELHRWAEVQRRAAESRLDQLHRLMKATRQYEGTTREWLQDATLELIAHETALVSELGELVGATG